MEYILKNMSENMTDETTLANNQDIDIELQYSMLTIIKVMSQPMGNDEKGCIEPVFRQLGGPEALTLHLSII